METLALLVALLATPATTPAPSTPPAVIAPATPAIGAPLEYPPWELIQHDFREVDVVAHVHITRVDTARVVWTDSTSVAPRQIGYIVYKTTASVAEVFEDRHGRIGRRAHDIEYFSSIEAGFAWRQEMLAAPDRIVFLDHEPHASPTTFDEVRNSGCPATADLIEKLRVLRKTPPENSGANLARH